MKTVDIYIDTSIKGPKRRDGWYTYIIAMDTAAGTADTGDTIKVEDTTENQTTLFALEAALKRIKKSCHLVLHLENNYVAAALKNRWYEQWWHDGWLTAKNKPVCDVAIWQNIQCLLNAHDFEVQLKQPHTYREWMKEKLKEKEGK